MIMVARFYASQRWWLLRLAALPVQLLAFALVVFFLLRAIPGDPVAMVSGGQFTPESYRQLQHLMGLDGSLWEQLARSMARLARLDLGDSLVSGRSIATDLAVKLPLTLELAGLALLVTILLAGAASYLVITRPRSPVSWLIRHYAAAAGAVPEFALGIAAIFIFYATLHWAPAPIGLLSPRISAPMAVTGMPLIDALLAGRGDAVASIASHLALPVLVMAVAQTPALLNILLADLAAAIAAPATRFRLATGARHFVVLLSIYRRALPASVTMLGTMFGHLLGGAIVIETLFGLDGLGRYLIEAVQSSDLTTVQAVLLVSAALSLLVFLAVDLLNMLLDPRRRAGVGIGP